MNGTADILHALTVDVEDWFQVENLAAAIDRSRWDTYESRVERNTERLLALFGELDVKATFFILGWVAERFPELVRTIAEAGHEIGTHGYAHRMINHQSPTEFQEDVQRSLEVLQPLVNEPIVSYRAPSFSIMPQTRWALTVLREVGLEVDSSVFPIERGRYGYPGMPRTPFVAETSAGPVLEFPPATALLPGGKPLPVAGGGYLRLFPLALIRWGIAQLERLGAPAVVYLHPWEIDPGQPRLAVPWPQRWMHYVHLDQAYDKWRRLLGAFRFGRLCDVRARLNTEKLPRIRFADDS